MLDSCYDSSKKFFELDVNIKKKYHNPKLKGARGYTPIGIETAVGEKIADQKEFWHHGPVTDDSYDASIPENMYIEELPEFNTSFDNLFNELNSIGLRVLKVIAKSLDLPIDYFVKWVISPAKILLVFSLSLTTNPPSSSILIASPFTFP